MKNEKIMTVKCALVLLTWYDDKFVDGLDVDARPGEDVEMLLN